jgi:hypothetical protein
MVVTNIFATEFMRICRALRKEWILVLYCSHPINSGRTKINAEHRRIARFEGCVQVKTHARMHKRRGDLMHGDKNADIHTGVAHVGLLSKVLRFLCPGLAGPILQRL